MRLFVIFAILITSCQPMQQEKNATSTASNGNTISQDLKPDENGYANVNGLKMYYEVYGL